MHIKRALQWGAGLAFCFAAIYIFFLRPCIEPICVTKTVPWLSSLIEGSYPVDFYLKRADRLAVVSFISLFFVFLVIPASKRLLTAFFLEKDSVWNLAVFRIIFFGFVLFWFDKEKVLWFSQLPPELIIPPFGCKFLLSHIPINPVLVSFISDVFIVSCIFAMIGFLTKTSAWVAVVTGWYVFGIPQFYGKADHYHHLLWFMAIIGSGACADVLSVDSIFKGIRHADKGYQLTPTEKSRQYALPLRFIWILMGVIYFFPGLWKFLKFQWHWAFSDNVRNQMYAKWFELSGWTPAFRIDHYPWLYKMTGLATMVFELTFIGLILFPFLRWVAVAGGLMFHNMTKAFMFISFIPLQICYLSFINWAGIFGRLGKIFFKENLFVLYDGNCKICRRTIAVLQRFDIFERIVYVNALDNAQLNYFGLAWVDSPELAQDMHVAIGKNKWKGFEAYRALAVRIPMFWFVWLLLWIWPVPQIGKAIYRKIADSRLCSVRLQLQHKDASADSYVTIGIKIVGSILIFINVLFGLSHKIKSWPFACYPTFAGIIDRPEIAVISFIGIKNGEEEPIDIEVFKKRISPQKYAGLIEAIARDQNEKRKKNRLRKLFMVMSQSGVDIKKYSKIRFYTTVKSTVPEKYSSAPISRVFLFEIESNGI